MMIAFGIDDTSTTIMSLYGSLVVALAIGFLIGLQRAQASVADDSSSPTTSELRERPSGRSIGGIRTYPLVALVGAVAALLVPSVGMVALAIAGLGVLVPIALAYADDLRSGRQRGLTTEMALLITFLLGAFSASIPTIPIDKQRWLLSATVGIVVTSVLSLKQPLHTLAQRISREDLLAWLKFAIVAVVIVPLLPDEAYGPLPELRVLNPFKIGIMVVLVAGLSLVGYGAMRWLGPSRGLSVTGVIGGIVSSTAVTLAMSQRSKSHAALEQPCALAVVLANSIMPLRVVVIVFLAQRELALAIAPELLAMAATGVLSTFIFRRRIHSGESVGPSSDVVIANPFELGSALKFGALFAVILVLTRFAERQLGEAGLYAAGFVAGITDLDAITLSMTQLLNGGNSVTVGIASNVVLIAVVANTLFKAGLARMLGSRRYSDAVLVSFAAMFVVALAAHFGIG